MTGKGKSSPAGTIAVTPGQAPAFGGTVSLDWAYIGGAPSFYYPMILVQAYQPGNPLAYDGKGLVYGELERPIGSPFAFGPLGGGSSAWAESGGGAAHCVATLALYPGLHSGEIVILDSVEFDAA